MAATVSQVFLALFFFITSLWHIYWAAGGKVGIVAAVPESHGKPLFIPGRVVTTMIALLLGGCSLVVTFQLFDFRNNYFDVLLKPFYIALSLLFFLRVVGDFKYVGLFKRITDSRFARFDRLFYTPLCLSVSAAALINWLQQVLQPVNAT